MNVIKTVRFELALIKRVMHGQAHRWSRRILVWGQEDDLLSMKECFNVKRIFV